MKIVITSSGPDMDSAVDPRFGRAAYFLIVDNENGELLETISNSSGIDASQGAGINAAAMLADKGVGLLLTGRLGPKAMAVVEKAKIKVVPDISGTVRDTVEHFRSGGRLSSESSTDQGGAKNGAGSGRKPDDGTGVSDDGKGCGKGRGNGSGQCGGGGGKGRGKGSGQCGSSGGKGHGLYKQ